jgi:transposase-like protein
VDQHGVVLDILVTSRRDATAATRFFRKLLKGLEYVPRVLVTDQLRRGSPATDTQCGTPPIQISEQSGREFPPIDPAAGTGDEEVQLAGEP